MKPCIQCGNPQRYRQRAICYKCVKLYWKAKAAEYRIRDGIKPTQRRRDGMCPHCTNTPRPKGRSYCYACERADQNKRRREHREKYREQYRRYALNRSLRKHGLL